MFLKPEEIIKISCDVINEWHAREQRISSFNDAVKLIKNKNENEIFHHIELLSWINTYLWHEEDKARDPGAVDSAIAGIKRKIDKLNAMRVNKTEEIDNILFQKINFNDKAPLNTETLGSVIDRLTIIALKKYHMDYEAKRKGASNEIRDKCAAALIAINRQMDDLSEAYNILSDEIISGKRRYALYRQFKMYNDPDLNPVIYNKNRTRSRSEME